MKTLLIDIETAPAEAYIWGLKTRYVPISQVKEDSFMLSFAAGWLDSDEIEFASRWDHGEEAMIKWAWELLDEADAVITYNGDNFDLPWLRRYFLQYRLGPTSPYYSIDLIKTVRKFRGLSNSLTYMLELLSLENKIETGGFQLWLDVMDEVPEACALMEEYNMRDVTTMEELYYQLRPWITNHPNVALYMDPSEEPKCTHCGSTDLRFKGYKRTRVLSYKQYQCNDCGTYSRARYAEEKGNARRSDILR